MINFKEELLEALKLHNKTTNDILWVEAVNKENEKIEINLRYFLFSLDFLYDNGYGMVRINTQLKIVGSNWWLEREEYDGSEWWEFKEYPTRPEIKVDKFKYH